MTALRCPEVLVHLESYRRGEASDELALLIDEHLARCPECRRRLARLKQLTAMLEAWRPRAVPGEVKIAAAEAVSEELGRAAREAFPRGRRGAVRRRRRLLPRLTSAQRVANILATVALAFLAGAILWRMFVVQETGDGAPAGGTPPAIVQPAGRTMVRLVSPGERRAEVVRLVGQVLGVDAAAAERFVERVPRTLAEGLTRSNAEALAARFQAAGATVELREAPPPEGE